MIRIDTIEPDVIHTFICEWNIYQLQVSQNNKKKIDEINVAKKLKYETKQSIIINKQKIYTPRIVLGYGKYKLIIMQYT